MRAAGGAAGMLALPSVASAAGRRLTGYEAPAATSASRPAFESFHSRPDLRPPIVTQTAGPGSGGAGAAAVVSEGYSFLAPHAGGGSQAGLMILDSGGDVVWFHPLARGRWATSFAAQQYRGEPVLTWWEGTLVNPPGYGHGEGVIMDSSYRVVARVRAGRGRSADLHEFVLTPQGTALITCYPTMVQRDLSGVGGAGRGPVLESVMQEIDVATGRVLLDWRSLDHIGLAESHSATYDPVHLNSIEVLPDGHLLVSARHTFALYKVHRRSGRIIWRLGGKRSDFHLGPHAKFSWQHDARHPAPNTITLFDDGAGLQATASQSRGVVLDVDFKRRTVKLNRGYRHPRPILASAMGSTRKLPDGNVVVGFGSAPVLSEFAADGSLISDLHLIPSQTTYRGVRAAWSATPTSPPAIAAGPGGASGTVTLYASWNGATSLSSWRVSVGASPGSLAPVTETPRAGFETAIPIPAATGYAAVTALDASGRVLASSQAIPLP